VFIFLYVFKIKNVVNFGDFNHMNASMKNVDY